MNIKKKKEGIFSILIWCLAISSSVIIISPRLTPVLLFLMIIIGVIIFIDSGESLKKYTKRIFFSDLNKFIITLVVFVAYLIFNVLYFSDNFHVIFKVFMVLGFIFSILTTVWLKENLGGCHINSIGYCIVIGWLIGAFYLLVEFIFDGQVILMVINTIPSLFSERHKGITSVGGSKELSDAADFFFNKNVSGLSLIFWPALLFVTTWANLFLRYLSMIAIIALAIIVTFASDNETAKVALVVSAFSFPVACFFPLILHWTIITAWSMAVLLIIPIVFFAYGMNLQEASFLPMSARDRLHIWYYSTQYITKKPLLGHGINYTKTLKKTFQHAPHERSQLYNRPGHHPHNFFLQIWSELGAVGAAIILALGLFLLSLIKTLPMGVKPYAYAVFMSVFVTSAFGWGMWQSWLISSYAFAYIFFLFAMSCVQKS